MWRHRPSHGEPDRACERHRAALARSTCERIWHPPADLARCSPDGSAHRTVVVPLWVRSTHSSGDPTSRRGVRGALLQEVVFAVRAQTVATRYPRPVGLRSSIAKPPTTTRPHAGTARNEDWRGWQAVIYQWDLRSDIRHQCFGEPSNVLSGQSSQQPNSSRTQEFQNQPAPKCSILKRIPHTVRRQPVTSDRA